MAAKTQTPLNIRIEIDDTCKTRSNSGISKRTGKPYEIASQQVWAFLHGAYPQKIELPIDSEMAAYEPGSYWLDLAPALVVGDFSRLAINAREFRLVRAA